ncbi:MAG: DUF3489 domain-containing protein [Terriglobia bacterium]|jgi:hypothetical protein
MTTFIIDTDLNIIAFPAPEAAQDGLAQGAMSFTSQKELAKLTAAWAATRLVEVWNGFAGVVPFDDCKPVKKFTDRRRALTRIWQAIQRLTPAAHEGAREAPSPAATGEPRPKKVVPQARRSARQAKPHPPGVREGSKKAQVIGLLRRAQGATNPEIQKATGWQSHTVRGFLSGHLGKRMKLSVETLAREDGARAYHLA